MKVTIKTFFIFSLFVMLLIAGCSGSKSTTVVQQIVQGSSPVIQSLSVQGQPSVQGGKITATVVASSEQGLGLTYTWTAYTGWSVMSGGSTPTATIQAPDAYGVSGTATVEVSDTNGRYALNTFPLNTVGDIAPVINSFNVSPNPVPKGGVTSMDVSATSPDGNSLYYTWQASNGWTIASGQGTSGITVTSPDQYGVSGTFTVTVYDAYSGTVTMEIPVSTSVKSFPVITGFSVSPQTNVTSTTMSFSAYAPDGDALTYLWVLGGFTSTDQTTVWNSPGIPGHYRVSLLVVDDPDGSIPNMDYYVHNIGSSLGITFTDSGDVAVSVSSTSISITSTSEWPKFQRDLQSTGQSPVDTSSITGTTKWFYQTGSETGNQVAGPPVIGADGTIYVGSWFDTLSALNPTDGSLKWTYTTTGSVMVSSPAIGADGTIYMGSGNGYLYALYPNGGLNWSFSTGFTESSSPSIGADGTIYIGGNNLYALNPTDGSVKWSYPIGSFGVNPAIGANGTIYVLAGNTELYAIYPDGSLKWSDTTDGYIDPAIGADGTIYAEGAGGLAALNPTDGSLKWKWVFPGVTYSIAASPAIGADGTIYFETTNRPGSPYPDLYAINPDGGLKWSYTTGDWLQSSPVIGADGTIYVTSETGNLYAINSNGGFKWKYTVAAQSASGDSSPVIGPDGTIYFGSSDGALYAIK